MFFIFFKTTFLVSSNQPSEPSHLPTVKFSNNFPYPHHSYKLHRRISKPIQPQLPLIPSYSNGAVVKIYDQPELLSVQVKRERQRRAMIDRMLTMFDEDGLYY